MAVEKSEFNADEFQSIISPEAITPEKLEFDPEEFRQLLLGDRPLQSPVTHASATAQLAAARGKLLETQALEAASVVPDQDDELSRAANELMDEVEAEIAGVASQVAGTHPAGVKGALDELNAGMKAVNRRRNHPVFPEMVVIEQATTIPLAERLHEDMAVNLANKNVLHKMMDEQGLFSVATGIEFLGLSVPLRHTLIWEQIKEGIENNDVLSLHITGDSIAGMITSFQRLSPAKRQILFPVLMNTVIAASGIESPILPSGQLTDKNMLGAISALIFFLDPEGANRASLEQKVILGLDLIPALAAIRNLNRVRPTLGNIEAFTAARKAAEARATGGARRPRPDTGFGFDPKRERETTTVDGEFTVKTNKAIAGLPKPVRQRMELLLRDATVRATREDSLMSLIARTGDKLQAARFGVAAMHDDVILRAAGINVQDILHSAMPWQNKEWINATIPNIIPELQQEFNDFHRRLEGSLRALSTESDLMQIGALNAIEKIAAKESFFEKMQKVTSDYMLEGTHLTGLKVGTETAGGFEFEYTLASVTGLFREVKGTVAWGIDDVTGNFTETVKNLKESPLGDLPGQSPFSWSSTKPGIERDFGDSVLTAVRASDLAVALKKRTLEFWRNASSSIALSQKKQRRVQAVEMAGSDYINEGTQQRGRVFTPAELTMGIPISPRIVQQFGLKETRIRLNDPAEVLAYYKRRDYTDYLNGVTNFALRRELQVEKYNTYFINSPAGEKSTLVRPFPTLADALVEIRGKVGFHIYDQATMTTQPVTKSLLTTLYEQGRALGRSREDWNISGNDLATGGEVVEFFIIDPVQIFPLPDQIAHYHPGYVPDISLGVEFVVRQKFPVQKRGVSERFVNKALRKFASRKDAKTYIELMKVQYAKKHPNISPKQLETMFEIADGSQMSQYRRAVDNLGGMNGLVTGTRAQDDILLGLEGIHPDRVSPNDALGRALDIIGDKLTINVWRMGEQQRWLNTVKAETGRTPLLGFKATPVPPGPLGDALNQMRKQIEVWTGVPTAKETAFETLVQRYHDSALTGVRAFDKFTGMGLSKEGIKHALWLKHADPLAAWRNANTHILLGFLNPSQLAVQASAMSVALSLSEIKNIPGILHTTAMWTILDNIQDETALSKMLELLKPIIGEVTNGELKALDDGMYMMWRRGGLLEAIENNADIRQVTQTGVGLSAMVLRRLKNISLVAYRAGEAINRRVAFIAAHARVKKARPHAKLDDEFLVETLNEANKTMMLLNPANRSYWQGGPQAGTAQNLLATMTQFWQVGVKPMEMLAKPEKRGGFSGRQKNRGVMGQWILFGAMGLPFLGAYGPGFVRWTADKMGLDSENPDDLAILGNVASLFNQGPIGFMSLMLTGIEVDLSGRFSIGRGPFDLLNDLLTGEDPLWVRALGLTNETLKRVGEATVDVAAELGVTNFSQLMVALGRLSPLALADRSEDPPLTAEKFLTVAQEIFDIGLTIPSSGRKILQTRIMVNAGVILNRRGQVVTRRDFTTAEKLATIFGFTLTSVSGIYEMQRTERDEDLMVRYASDVFIRKMHRWVYLYKMDPKFAASVTDMKATLDKSFNSNFLREQFRANIARRIWEDPQTLEEKQLLRFFEKQAVDEITNGALLDINNWIGAKGVLSRQPVVVPFANREHIFGNQDVDEENE